MALVSSDKEQLRYVTCKRWRILKEFQRKFDSELILSFGLLLNVEKCIPTTLDKWNELNLLYNFMRFNFLAVCDNDFKGHEQNICN